MHFTLLLIIKFTLVQFSLIQSSLLEVSPLGNGNYLSELMEDTNAFSWQSAKTSYAVLLSGMEEGKVEWSETFKFGRMRRAHVQRLPSQSANTALTRFQSDLKPAVCRFFQKGMCQHRKDSETGGRGGGCPIGIFLQLLLQ